MGSDAVKWKANAAGKSATAYDLYVKFGTYTGAGSFYTVDVPAGQWTHSGALGQSDPGSNSSTILVATKEWSVNNNLLVNSSGNVGIGTTSPGAKLEVNGTTRIAGGNSSNIQLVDNDNDNFLIHLNSDRLYFMRDDDNDLSWDDGEDDRIVMYGVGGAVRLGIGTSYPEATLDVRGEIRSKGSVGMNYTGITSSGNGAVNKAIVAQDYSQWIWNTATNWGIFWAGNDGAAYSKFGTTNPNEIVFVGGGNSRASIDLDNGNIKGSGLYGNLRNQVLYRKDKYNGTYIHGVDSSGNPATSGSNYRELPPGVSTGVYSWWNYADSVGEPSGSHGSAIGFGHGTSGTTEIWGGWTNGKLYTRFLRDCCQGWSAWRKILVEDANGNVGTSGHLTVGEGGYNKTIKVRHINGKDHDSDDNSALYLNYNTGQSVVVGKNDKYSNLVVYGNTTSNSFLYSSDQNKKKDIQTLSNPLETIQNLRGVSFSWKENDEASIGFIAQEVEKVLPSLVSGEAGEKSVAYGNITAVLVEAVKELSTQNKALEERVKALENR